MKQKVVKLNVEGEICPYPLIMTIKKIQEIKDGLELKEKILEVVTDCPPTIENIPAEFQRRGFKVNVEKISAARWRVTIKK